MEPAFKYEYAQIIKDKCQEIIKHVHTIENVTSVSKARCDTKRASEAIKKIEQSTVEMINAIIKFL